MTLQNYFRFALLAVFFCFFFLACDNAEKKQPPAAKDQLTLSQKEAIKKVIAADEAIGKVRNHACEKISLAETIQHYTDGLAAIDYSYCPEDFKKAFAKHRKAWLLLIPFVEKYPDMRGEMHDLFDQLEKGKDGETFKLMVNAVWDTWAEVEAAMKE